ncbi:uncharacterized protein BKA78DRAFT_10694 [Phyllosticta capitalensis]|uniref:uncharacterized protein n=1 Tax=Phyllosticta capitalensis TaxID=121624 RepID=UPI00312EDAF8
MDTGPRPGKCGRITTFKILMYVHVDTPTVGGHVRSRSTVQSPQPSRAPKKLQRRAVTPHVTICRDLPTNAVKRLICGASPKPSRSRTCWFPSFSLLSHFTTTHLQLLLRPLPPPDVASSTFKLAWSAWFHGVDQPYPGDWGTDVVASLPGYWPPHDPPPPAAGNDSAPAALTVQALYLAQSRPKNSCLHTTGKVANT